MRQFIYDRKISPDGMLAVEGKDFRYLRQVLRVRPGDMISVRLKDGTLQNATVAKINEGSKKIFLQVCSEDSGGSITRGVQATELDSTETRPEFWLMQFITKPQKFEVIVRQATECGVAKIIPVISEFSERSSVEVLRGAKKERLARVIREARQQSGSPVATEVTEPMTLEEAVRLWQGNALGGGSCGAGAAGEESFSEGMASAGMSFEVALGFVLYERTERTESLRKVIDSVGRGAIGKVCVCVGCEGGISPKEIEFLCEKALFHSLHFAVNILRAETAAIYGLAAVQTCILSK